MKIRTSLALAFSLLAASSAFALQTMTEAEQARVVYAKQVVQSLKVDEFTSAYVEGAEGKTLVFDVRFGPRGAPRSPLAEMQAKELGFTSVAYQYGTTGKLSVNLNYRH